MDECTCDDRCYFCNCHSFDYCSECTRDYCEYCARVWAAVYLDYWMYGDFNVCLICYKV